MNKDSSHANRSIIYNIAYCPSSKLNVCQLSSSDAYPGTFAEYKTRKLATACRSGGKLWRESGEGVSQDDYDPMGDSNVYAIDDMDD